MLVWAMEEFVLYLYNMDLNYGLITSHWNIYLDEKARLVLESKGGCCD
jgi:hypothetical protein